MNFSKNQKVIAFYLAIFIIGCFLITDIYVWGKNDRNCWFSWSNYIHFFGLQNIYKLGADYPPLIHYFLWIIAKKHNNSETLYLKIYELKYIILFFEMISIYTVYYILESKKIALSYLLPLLILLNISFWYNNFLFGQVDGVYTAFAFISIVLAIFKKSTYSILIFILCINFKFQGVIFFPILAIILFADLKKYSFSKIILTLLPSILLQIIIFIPFILTGDIKLALDSFSKSVHRYPFVSMGAYNIWSLFFSHPERINDLNGIFNISFNSIGLIIFFGLSGLILLPWGLKSLGVFDKRIKIEFSIENILLVTTLIILIFFYFNTQMHSRYSHPTVLFAGTLAILRKDYFKYALLSLAIFLNMEGSSKILKGGISEFETIWFQPWFVSIIFLVVITLYSYDYIILLFKDLKMLSK